MEAASTVALAEMPTLERVAHAQTNELYDVVALLAAIADRLDTRASVRADDELHYTLRLAQMARERVDSVISAFDPYI